MANRQLAVGVDFGGTKCLSAVVDVASGEVLGTGKKKTRSDDGPQELMERIYATVDDALKDAKVDSGEIAGIGVGIAGQVDADKGILLGTANLARSVVDLPMAAHLSDRYGVPAALRNDVQIAAIGEARFGAGKDVDDFMCVFVGTGIGGAIVRNGELVHGASGSAGELGHTIVMANGRICGCGARGHLEAYASRTAITKVLLGEMRRGRKTILWDLLPGVDPVHPAESGAIRSGVLKKAVEAKDEVAVEAVTEAGRFLGYGLAMVVNVLNPRRIILGGGAIEALDLLFDEAERSTRREALPVAGDRVEFVKAGLGDDAGVVGAAVIGASTGR
jgi:glucokinase